MLAPNPQAEMYAHQADGTKEANSTFFEKFVFAVLVVAYALAIAALLLPVVAYVYW